MKKKYPVICCLMAVAILSGCVSMDKNKAIVYLQSATASQIGLGSSDEVTVSSVAYGEKNALGGQPVSYRATTGKGRTFDCKATLMDGTILTEASVTSPSCTPVSVHK
jgi:hypothetical protein